MANIKKYPRGISVNTHTGRLRGRFKFRGKTYEIYQTDGETDSKFKKRFESFRYEVEHGLFIKEENILFNDWYERWISHYSKVPTRATRRRPKKHTIDTYNYVYYKLLKEKFGRMKVSEISSASINNFFDGICDLYSDAKITQAKVVLRSALDYAYKNDVISANPFAKADIACSSKATKEVFALTVEQEDLFMEYAKKSYHYPVIVVMDRAGLRIGEALALRNSDIDYNNMKICVNNQVYYDRASKSRYLTDPKTAAGKRKVTMFKDVRMVLQSHQEEMKKMAEKYSTFNNEENLLFCARYHGGFICDTAIRAAITSIIKDIKKDGHEFPDNVTPHTFRHTFATRCFEKNIPLEVISKELGHSDVSITARIYVHLLPDFQTAEMLKMEKE